MTGKICLTRSQCAPVNEGLSPSQDEITWAREFFAEFERDGGEIRNGSDLPRIARATKILDLARAYGITESEFDDDPVHAPARRTPTTSEPHGSRCSPDGCSRRSMW